jgi:hypothetical protein
LLLILLKLLTEIDEPKLCISNTDTLLPSLAKLMIEAFEPIRLTLLTLKLEPIETKSNVDRELPNRPKLLMETAEPIHCSWSRERTLFTRNLPKILKFEPQLVYDRVESVDPKDNIAITLILLAALACEVIDNVLPILQNVLTLKALPKLTKSNIDIELASLQQP